MERRRTSDISEDVLYPKLTKYLRIVEMILCLVCLCLAFYFWSAGNNLLGAIVILFATSFGFLAVTFIDVMAALRHRQYSAPIWAGLAFLAAFMFFLSFGLMALQRFVPYILIGVVFAVTGIVFLIDGIIIIMRFFQSKLPKKVHPISKEKEGRISKEKEGRKVDKATQIEEDFGIIEEVPIAVKRIVPEFSKPHGKKVKTADENTSPRSSFPITSYGGTFPVGGNDELPLPTPGFLTGLESAVTPQPSVPRRNNTQESSPERRSVSSESTSPRHLSIEEIENIYPSIREESMHEQRSPSLDHGDHVLREPGVSQPIRSISYSSGATYNQQSDEHSTQMYSRQNEEILPAKANPQYEELPFSRQSQELSSSTYNRQSQELPPATYNPQSEKLPPATYNRQNIEVPAAAYNRQNVEVPAATYNRQNEELPPATYDRQIEELQPPENVKAQSTRAPSQTRGLPSHHHGHMMSPYQAAGEPQPTVNIPPRAPPDVRPQREILPGNAQTCQCCAARATREARDQVTPFVTHHYNQTPCICGYTHYQASTVVKGAVKQYPQDTVRQQQKMIKDQLDQMRDSNVYHGCSCHDEPTKETKGPNVHPVRDSPILEDSNSLNSLENPLEIIATRPTEQNSNTSLNSDDDNLDALTKNSQRQTNSRTPRRLGSDDSRRRVTIGTLEIKASSLGSNDSSNISKRRRWQEQTYTQESLQENQQRPNDRKQSKRSSMKHEKALEENRQPSMADNFEADYDDLDQTAEDYAAFRRRLRELNDSEDLSKITVISRDLDRSSSSIYGSKKSDASTPVSNENLESKSPKYDSQYPRKRSSKLGNKEILDSYESFLGKRSTPSNQPVGTNNNNISEGQEAQRSVASLPFERSNAVCRGIPPRCHCCPNANNKTRRYPISTNGGKKQNEPSTGQYRRRSEKDRRNALDKTFVISEPSLVPINEPVSSQVPGDIPEEDMKYPQKVTSVDKKSSPITHLESDNTPKISNPPVKLPRSLDPIEEHESREGIYPIDSQENISEFPSCYSRFPEDVVMKASCRCSCICNPQKIPKDIPKEPKKSTASNTKKYDSAPLDRKPYHPKDEFKLPKAPFTENSPIIESPEDCMCEATAPPRRRSNIQKRTPSRTSYREDYQPLRTLQLELTVLDKRPHRKNSLECLEECADCSTKRKKPERECPQECSSCPIRRARLTREAELDEELDEERSSRYLQRERFQYRTSKRGSLKRSHPDESR